jgi:hypothetical protein
MIKLDTFATKIMFNKGTVARKSEGTNKNPAPAEKVKQAYSDELCHVGLFGLSVVGQNFALNMAEHGFKVCVGN